MSNIDKIILNGVEYGIGGSGSGLTNDVKVALLEIAEKVAYTDDDGQDYYDALETALFPPANLASITAVYTQSGTVYNTDSLNSLKVDLVVTAHYDDSTAATVTAYALTGSLTVGTSTITVIYGGKTTTFNVTVTEAPLVPSSYTQRNYIQNSGGAYINTGLKEYPSGTSGYRLTKYEGEFAAYNTGSSEVFLFGYAGLTTGSGNTTFRLTVLIDTSNKLHYYAYDHGGTSGISNEIGGWNSSSTNDMVIDMTTASTKPIFTVNEVETTGNRDSTPNAINNSCDFYLMDRNVNGEGGYTGSYASGTYVRCYRFKMYKDGVLARDFVPCTRNSDSAVGFYDTVTAAFYPSITETPFTYG